MNNEPVAWMLNGIVHEFDPSDWSKERYLEQAVIPLYTHPAKTLTDEEMTSYFYSCHFNDEYDVRDFIEFARAILKKASE